MTQDAATLLREALALADDDRVALAAELLASVEPGHTAESADAWARDVERRIDRFAAGESTGIDLDDAVRQVEAARTTTAG